MYLNYGCDEIVFAYIALKRVYLLKLHKKEFIFI